MWERQLRETGRCVQLRETSFGRIRQLSDTGVIVVSNWNTKPKTSINPTRLNTEKYSLNTDIFPVSSCTLYSNLTDLTFPFNCIYCSLVHGGFLLRLKSSRCFSPCGIDLLISTSILTVCNLRQSLIMFFFRDNKILPTQGQGHAYRQAC